MYFKHRTFNTRWGEVCRTKSAFCAGHRALPLCGCEKPSAGRTPELPRELPSPLLILQASSTRGKPWFLPPSRRCGVRQGAGRTRCPGSPQPRVAPRSTPGTARGRGRGRGRRAPYLFCQPWRRLVYLLSTPSSAGSLLRPPPPDGLAATEPGLLRLPPPPSPAAPERLATPRPAREQEGEEPAEVARLLLRLLLLLPPPPPPSALWAALSMIAARPGSGWPPRWQPGRRRLSCRRRRCSSGLPGRAWLLRFPGKCLTHTGGRRGGGKRGLGRKPAGLDAAAAAPPPASTRARPRPPATSRASSGLQVPPPPPAPGPLQLLGDPG